MFLDCSHLNFFFPIIKLNNFRGNLADVSAKTLREVSGRPILKRFLPVILFSKLFCFGGGDSDP